MGKMKWFGLAAVGTAVAAGTAVAVRKMKERPEKASEMFDTAKSKVVRGTDEVDLEVELVEVEAVDEEATT